MSRLVAPNRGDFGSGGVGHGSDDAGAVGRGAQSGKLRAVSLSRRGLFREWCAATIDDGLLPDYLEECIDLLADTKLNSHLACAERNPHHGRTTFRENENALQADRS